MTGLPQGWASAKIPDVLAELPTGNIIDQGWSPKCENFPSEKEETWGALKTTAIQDGRFEPQHTKQLPDHLEPKPALEVREGDLLMTCAGPRVRCGVICRVERVRPKLFISGKMYRFRPNPEVVDGDYLLGALRSPDLQLAIDQIKTGGSESGLNLTQDRFKSLTLPLPPLPEQRRIVRKLDTLSARSTTARTHLTAIERLVERYKVAVLGQLFGKSGSDPKPTEHLWAIPSNWSWKKVKDIGDVGLGRQRSPENHDGPFMRPYIRSANITWQGVDISDVKEMNFDAADFERFQLKPGDVLLNEGSGSAKEVGKPAIWRGEIPDCCYQNTVLRVQPRDCTSEYLYWYFLLTALSEGFVGDTKGVNIQHIGKNGLANFPIPVPPLDEQREIVRRIETAFAKIDRLAAEAAKALKLLGHLDQRILAKAFAGDLVPQDPTDEPAETLLARIHEARASAPKGKRGRKFGAS